MGRGGTGEDCAGDKSDGKLWVEEEKEVEETLLV